MENISLTSRRKEELLTLWVAFKGRFSGDEMDGLTKDSDEIKRQWSEYGNKSLDGTFSLDEYTNRIGRENAVMPGGYLCNFLERTTRTVYGSAKPGNANNYEVKLNDDGLTYTVRSELKPKEKKNEIGEGEANNIFEKEIKPLIKDIFSCEDSDKLVPIVENNSYAAKQVLRKLCALIHPSDFLYIYSDSAIDALHKEFIGSEETTNLGKSFKIRSFFGEVFSVDSSPEENILLSRFLWKYATTKGLADKATPNVILYGPPGTGKTFSVKSSLDFLCQGDRERYEFVQFHPSFTYEDFIEGIKPKGVSADGNIKFELVDGIFKRFCKKAKLHLGETESEDKAFYFVVDEINRANLSSVFGETLLCLEKDYRHDGGDKENLIKTQYSSLIEDMIREDSANERLAYHLVKNGESCNAYFGVPRNVYFIGMMNDVDKSIDAFDLALRRRFKWIRKDCDYDVIESHVKFRNGDDFTNIDEYSRACRKLNKYISDELGMGASYEFGHSFFMKITDIAASKKISVKNMEELFDLYLSPTLKEYLRAMFSERELGGRLGQALEEFVSLVKKGKK